MILGAYGSATSFGGLSGPAFLCLVVNLPQVQLRLDLVSHAAVVVPIVRATNRHAGVVLAVERFQRVIAAKTIKTKACASLALVLAKGCSASGITASSSRVGSMAASGSLLDIGPLPFRLSCSYAGLECSSLVEVDGVLLAVADRLSLFQGRGLV